MDDRPCFGRTESGLPAGSSPFILRRSRPALYPADVVLFSAARLPDARDIRRSHPARRTYRGEVEDPEVVRALKRRCTRAVLLGLATMALALLLSAAELAPDLLTTVAAIAGFSLVMYGVHVGWVIFYDRETDGPPA